MGPAPDRQLSFRRATPDDVDGVVALVESAFRGETSRAGWTTEADLLDGQRTDQAQVSAIVHSAGAQVLLAEAGALLIGCCELSGAPGGPAHLGMLAVRPDRQGRGAGGALMDEAETTAVQAWSAGEMRLTVIRQRTELIDWYARRGYRPTGETAPFPYGDPRFGLPRREDLEFIVMAKPLR